MSGMFSMPTFTFYHIVNFSRKGFFTLGIGRLFLVERMTSAKIAAVMMRYVITELAGLFVISGIATASGVYS
jgi:hypothetical protein